MMWPKPTPWTPTQSFHFPFVCLFIYLFIYFWLCWVFVSVRGLSLVAASGGHSSSRCAGLSLSRPLLLRSTGSRRAGSAVVAHGPSCSAACAIFPDQGSNPCSLHEQADSQPLRHQGSPTFPPYSYITSMCFLEYAKISHAFCLCTSAHLPERNPTFLWQIHTHSPRFTSTTFSL